MNTKYTNKTLMNIINFFVDNKKECIKYHKMANDTNISSCYKKITKFDIDKIYPKLTETSVLLLTANKYEKNILHQMIYQDTSEKILRFDIEELNTHGYIFKWGKYNVLHIESTVTGSYTLGGSADVVRYALQSDFLSPSVVISYGVCFGTECEKNKLGDTIISKKIYPYFVGIKIKDKIEESKVIDDNRFKIDDNLNTQIQQDLFDMNRFSPDVYFDNYITGEAVVSNEKFRNFFAKTATNQDVIAGEMEGYGVFKECTWNNYKVPCFLVKSICDWGACKNFENADTSIFENAGMTDDDKKILKDSIQAYASYKSYIATSIIMKDMQFHTSIYDEAVGIIDQYISDGSSTIRKDVFFNELSAILKNRNKGLMLTKKLFENIMNNLISNDLIKNINDNSENYIIVR